MKFLFDSLGNHIANMVGDQLHSPRGVNIGHYLSNYEIFIDMRGRYLGELPLEDRLMQRVNSPYKLTNFGSFGNFGNVGNFGNPGRYGRIGMIGGFVDIPKEKLI